jgi:hypothetical protein
MPSRAVVDSPAPATGRTSLSPADDQFHRIDGLACQAC